ncbi:MAG: LysR family transcriptional regulator [Lachnospiraceae bacterium]|nr:LysR family transcriptional regulator [Lachnospiraceae bacterium]
MDEALSLSSYLVFNTVARNGNLSSAAKELTISQPAVSRSLQRLEEGLAVKLFVRSSRGVRLTDEGELLYEHTRPAFDSLAQAERALKAHNSTGIETIKLGVSANLCKPLFTPSLKNVLKNHPLIKMDLRIASTFELMEAVERGELDAALITRPVSVHRLEYEEIAAFHDILVAAPSYITLLKSSNISLDDEAIFAVARLLIPPKSSCTGVLFRSALSDKGINPSMITEADSLDSCLDFAISGLGITLLPEPFAEDHIRSGALDRLSLDVPVIGHSVGVIYEKTTTQRVNVMSLVHTLITEEKV